MICGKVFLCVALLMLFGLSGSAAQSDSAKDAAQEKPETEPSPSVVPPAEEASKAVTTSANATRILDALRSELARRRSEREQQQQQRTQDRREQILRTLESLSDRKREYELRRQEALQDAATMREARRLEMEARRVGRLPLRERERANRARLDQLVEQTTPEKNEIGSSTTDDEADREVDSEAAQRVRNLLLIEEANGNLRLIDLDTEEGQQIALEGVQRALDGGANDEMGEKEEVTKRKLKIGQI